MEKKDVKYLAFEGGGGKGAAYLGAVAALEDLEVLPIDPLKNVVDKSTVPYYLKQGGNQVKGVSGSSAGAITALCLSIGMKAKDIATELQNPHQFMDFFDVPRQKNDAGRCGQRIKSVEWGNGHPFGGGVELKNAAGLGFFGNVILNSLRNLFSSALRKDPVAKRIAFNEESHACYKKPQKVTNISGGSNMSYPAQDDIFFDHIRQLMYSGGIFPGIGSRVFFRKILLRYLFGFPERVSLAFAKDLNKSLGVYNVTNVMTFLKENGVDENPMLKRFKATITDLWWNNLMASPRDFFNELMNIDFKTLFYLTGVQLVVTGSNVTYAAPRVFSVDYTPDFPVAEAVSISMNLPVVFSPVAVRCQVISRVWFERNAQVSDNPYTDWFAYNHRYRGLYVDGGVQLNYPLHLFNAPEGRPYYEFNLAEKRIRTQDLNPHTLGFRLGLPDKKTVPFDSDADVLAQLDLGTYMGNLVGTMMFFSEDGQVRTKREFEQTITIDTGSLGTLDFAPSRTKGEAPIRNAYQKTIQRLFPYPMGEANLDKVINMLPK